MSRPDRVAERLTARPARSLFVLLVAVPATLAVFSFRQPAALPDSVLSELELLFRLFVYAPVALFRSFVFEPLGLDIVFSVPGLEQAAVVLTLLGFYYAVSFAVVRGGRRLLRRLESLVR